MFEPANGHQTAVLLVEDRLPINLISEVEFRQEWDKWEASGRDMKKVERVLAKLTVWAEEVIRSERRELNKLDDWSYHVVLHVGFYAGVVIGQNSSFEAFKTTVYEYFKDNNINCPTLG